MIVLQPTHNRNHIQRRDSIPRAHLAQVVELFFQRDCSVHPHDDGLETITMTLNECGTDSSASLLKPAQPSCAKQQIREYLINIHCLTDMLLSSFGLGSSKYAWTHYCDKQYLCFRTDTTFGTAILQPHWLMLISCLLPLGRGNPIQTEWSARFRDVFSRGQNLSRVTFEHLTCTCEYAGYTDGIRMMKKKKLTTSFS